MDIGWMDVIASFGSIGHYFIEDIPNVNLFSYFCKISSVLARFCKCTKL